MVHNKAATSSIIMGTAEGCEKLSVLRFLAVAHLSLAGAAIKYHTNRPQLCM